MASQLSILFEAHDRGYKEEALDACIRVDTLQFQYLDSVSVELASSAFIDALWAKDEVEFGHLRDGRIDQDGLRSADYGPVRQKLRERAMIVGADPAYATNKATAWRRHKTGGDYWTPYQRAQLYELRAALQDPDYPRKRRHGRSGPGPEAMRYVLASELHDMNDEKYVTQGIDVLVPYFELILEGTDNESDH